ncbi:response regulator [Rhodopseudomonas palustris]|uniref:response regulator transcription factor n=1 Tax=Rhodopseudomonas palustris TaxID=1076 RepID=UPI0021F283F9|nr:response regulator [Rhodopseudomonas palustris]UYO45949.1 response regulator [Rhodopseudomonas palustris]
MINSRQADATEAKIVIVIDDDPSVRKSLTNLLQSVGLDARTFASIEEFLRWPLPDAAVCMVLDIRMPGRNGLDFQQDLASSDGAVPIIFITAHGDIPMSVRAMKAGAIEFLTKPFRDQDLLDAIQTGLELSRSRREEIAAASILMSRYESLSGRERQVMEFVVSGQLTKQIAAKLGLSEITVKVCRANLMKKMCAGSMLELGKMSERLTRLRGAQPE